MNARPLATALTGLLLAGCSAVPAPEKEKAPFPLITTATGSALDCSTMLHANYLKFDPLQYMTAKDEASTQMMYDRLRTLLWGEDMRYPDDVPEVAYNVENPFPGIQEAATVDRIGFTTLGIASNVFHFRPKQRNGAAVIVHEGHIKTFGRDGLRPLANTLVAEGFDVFTMEMPLYGQNGPAGQQNISHNSLVRDLEKAGEQPLRPFVEPVLRTLDYIDAALPGTRIGMTGLSGGGYVTVLAAAADRRIAVSVPVAGSLPVHLRTGPCLTSGEYGDLEQRYRPFFDNMGYLDLYVLGTAGKRRQTHVVNQFDTCCFGGLKYLTYEKIIEDIVSGMGGMFVTQLDSTGKKHWVSPYATEAFVLPELRKLVP